MVLRTILIALGAFLGQALSVSGKACTSTLLTILLQLITTLHQPSRILACRLSTCFFNDLLVDNCLVISKNTTFQQRLLQNQLAYPPNEGDIIWSPPTIEVAYNNGAISYITSPKAETYAITGPNCIYSGTMDSMWRLRTIMMQTRPKLAIQRE